MSKKCSLCVKKYKDFDKLIFVEGEIAHIDCYEKMANGIYGISEFKM